MSHFQKALRAAQNENYGSAADHLSETEEFELEAEFERLEQLLGNNTNLLSGKLGQVISNYNERLIEELAQLSHLKEVEGSSED